MLTRQTISISTSRRRTSRLPTHPLFLPGRILFPIAFQILRFRPQILRFRSRRATMRFTPIQRRDSPLFPFWRPFRRQLPLQSGPRLCHRTLPVATLRPPFRTLFYRLFPYPCSSVPLGTRPCGGRYQRIENGPATFRPIRARHRPWSQCPSSFLPAL